MTVLEHDWAELENGQSFGTTRRRLAPDSRHDLFLAVRHPSKQRLLSLRLDLPSARRVARRLERAPGTTEGIELALFEGSDHYDLELRLRDRLVAEVFDVLVGDVVSVVAAAEDSTAAVEAMMERFDHWVRLLRSLAAEGLSVQRRRGLFGELLMLRRLLKTGVGETTALEGWSGPDEANQDFQLTQVAIEVKTSAGREPRHLPITSERQLDPSNCGTLLLCHFLVDERRGGEGQTLTGLANEIQQSLASARSVAEFEARLIRAGLLPHQRALYDDPRYSLRRDSTWHVRDAFPRIVENDLLPGVGSCSYEISTVGLEDYVVGEEPFKMLLAPGASND